MKNYVLSAMVIALTFTIGYMIGVRGVEADVQEAIDRVTKERNEQLETQRQENQNAWAKEAEARKKLAGANTTISNLTQRLRDATRANGVSESTTATLASLKADNAKLRKLLERCSEFLERSDREYGNCAVTHDATVDLYNTAK